MAETLPPHMQQFVAKLSQMEDGVPLFGFKEQAQFWLNAFWSDYDGKAKAAAEELWEYVEQCNKLVDRAQDGTTLVALAVLAASQFLQDNGKADLSVVQRKKEFKKIDVDSDGLMSLWEYMIWRHAKDFDSLSKFSDPQDVVKELMSRPQGVNKDLEDAKRALKEVQKLFEDTDKEQARLEKKGNDSDLGVVKRNRAKNKLAQLLSKWQPHNTEANKMMVEAKLALKRAKKSSNTNSMGSLWWAERELEEAKKYKPKSKQ